MRPGAGVTIRAFIRDWILFAPVAVWIALLFTLLTESNAIQEDLANGALITYALALAYAFLEDIPVVEWDGSRFAMLRALAVLVPLAKNVITVVALVHISIIFAQRTFPANELIDTGPDTTLFVSACLAGAALLLSIIVVSNRQRDGGQAGVS